MDITFSGKNMRVTKGIKEHLFEKVGKLDKYAPRIVEAHAVLKKEKYAYGVHLTLLGKNFKASGEGSEKENVYAAIDQAVDRVTKQLKKYREKIKDHRKQHGANTVPMKERVAERVTRSRETDYEETPDVIEMKPSTLKPMTIQEASMQLRVRKDPFLIFSNASTNQPNVIFRRNDGNHGLVAPKLK